MFESLCILSLLACSVLAQRSSYLDRFTTESPYGDRDSEESYSPNRGTSRRPSYVTDRWGDVASGGDHSHGRDRDSYGYGTTPRSPYARHTTDRWGDSGSSFGRTTSRFGSDSDSASSSRSYFQIQGHIHKLTNANGVLKDGSKCDTFSACDTQCYSYIDTDSPHATFPGSAQTNRWKFKEFKNGGNSPGPFTLADVGFNSKDVCGERFNEATYRVYCEDVDTDTNELINQFDCHITRKPDSSESGAQWHTATCVPKSVPNKMSMTIRYKIFAVSRASCDPANDSLRPFSIARNVARE